MRWLIAVDQHSAGGVLCLLTFLQLTLQVRNYR